jgi:hypothetical protein
VEEQALFPSVRCVQTLRAQPFVASLTKTSVWGGLRIVRKAFTFRHCGPAHTCDFCVAPIHQGHKFRERSAKSLVDEIERSYRELGVEFFYLWGDTVTLNVKSFSAAHSYDLELEQRHAWEEEIHILRSAAGT